MGALARMHARDALIFPGDYPVERGAWLYEWQFHWVAKRVCVLFDCFAGVVSGALDARDPD